VATAMMLSVICHFLFTPLPAKTDYETLLSGGSPLKGLLMASAGMAINQNKISPPTVHHIKLSFDRFAISLPRDAAAVSGLSRYK
jgi:hypothetical protein